MCNRYTTGADSASGVEPVLPLVDRSVMNRRLRKRRPVCLRGTVPHHAQGDSRVLPQYHPTMSRPFALQRCTVTTLIDLTRSVATRRSDTCDPDLEQAKWALPSIREARSAVSGRSIRGDPIAPG